MATDDSSPAETSGEVIAEKSTDGSSPRRKGQKVPKKAHKAEREKLKRDQLNDLFSELHNMLETDKQNNGKATILGDTTRILRDLLSQVDTLRKEQAALVKESHYVTQENNELRDEKGVLQTEIIELQNELRMRSMHMGGFDMQHWPPNPGMALSMPAPVSVNVPSLPIVPLPHQLPTPPTVYPAPSPPRELQLFPGTATREEHEQSAPVSSPVVPPAHVSTPHLRYSGLGEPWTGQFLVGRVRSEQEEQSSSGVENGLDRV